MPFFSGMRCLGLASLLGACVAGLGAADQPWEVVGQQLRHRWREQAEPPAKPAPDPIWCRRVYLDVVGRTPTVAELEAFRRDRSPEKRQQLVDRLLSSEYESEFADHWATVWTNLLIGRSGGTRRRDLTYRPGLVAYLRQCFLKRRSYALMAEDLITATGDTRPSQADGRSDAAAQYNPATNFLVGKFADEALQATTKTAQVFLGMQVQCTQCHDHFFNQWKQNQFWELNAFFRQTRPLRDFEGETLVNVRLVDEGFEGNGARPDAGDAKVFYELKNGQLRAAYPTFVDGTSLIDLYGEERGKSGYLEDINRRQELAKLILASEQFDRAIVNRYWAHFHGYGFTRPLDDMGPHNPPSHPDLLEYLAERFRAEGRQLRPLIRWIALSPSYGLSSRNPQPNAYGDPSSGSPPSFSRFYLRQLRPESLYESLRIASLGDRAPANGGWRVDRGTWLAQFVTASGNDEGGESSTFNGSITQTLMLMNGELIRAAINSEPGSFLHDLAMNRKLGFTGQVRHLYLTAVARPPDRKELRFASRLLRYHGGKSVDALQDIWWALLNSNEFILNH